MKGFLCCKINNLASHSCNGICDWGESNYAACLKNNNGRYYW